MEEIIKTNSIAETPKDGTWYQIPSINEEYTEYVKWDERNFQWDWFMLKDMVVVVEMSHLPEYQ